MKKSKSKTFQRDDEYGEVMDWIVKQIDYTQKENEPDSEFDLDSPCHLDAKYIVTVTKIDEP